MSRVTAAIVALGVLALSGVASAQFFRGPSTADHMATPESFDGKWHYCRAVRRQNPRGDGGNWLTDYPLADRDLSVRFAELTKTSVSFDKSGEPNYLIVRLTDEELYQCPIILMQEVGSLFLSDTDAATLRTYFLKGGFLWVDDFWGSYAWDVFATEMRKVFPPSEYPIFDVPPDHAIYHTMFDLKGVLQVPSINFWFNTGGTSERGFDSAQVHARGIADRNGRLMVFATHNTDVSDSWEREGEDPQYFYAFSPGGYQVAMNVLLYAMTH